MNELKCRVCSRYIGEAETIIAELMCPNTSCKATTQFKIINNDIEKLISYKFMTEPKKPKKARTEK